MRGWSLHRTRSDISAVAVVAVVAVVSVLARKDMHQKLHDGNSFMSRFCLIVVLFTRTGWLQVPAKIVLCATEVHPQIRHNSHQAHFTVGALAVQQREATSKVSLGDVKRKGSCI